MSLAPRLSHAPVPGGSLAYHVVGDGRAGHVIWSQWVAQHLDLMWTDPTLEATVGGLARDDLTTILVQPRGTGLSAPSPRAATLDEQAADLLAVMDAEGVETATIAAAGVGVPALILAAQHPARVRGLVLYGVPLTGPAIGGEDAGWTPEGARSAEAAWRHCVEAWGAGEVVQCWNAGLATPHNVRLSAMAERCSVGPELAKEYLEGSLVQDGRVVAAQVRVPVRVLGQPDNAAPLTAMRALADAIPGATYHELPRSVLGDTLGSAFVPIARHIAELARGRAARYGEHDLRFATVLFTDIVGSTEAVAEAGDAAWASTMREYLQLTRRAVTAGGGEVIKSTGDGTLCLFTSPAAAIGAAHAIGTQGHALGVETRAGVHAGECERLHEDLAGLAVHVGARICGLADPGEVLVSRAVRDLADVPELDFDARGEHDLKGVPGRWEAFAVRPADAPEGPVGAPRATTFDRALLGIARRAPRTVRAVNRAGDAVQRRRAGRRRPSAT